MVKALKTLEQQVLAMRRRRPELEPAPFLGGRIAWFGPLIGIARPYQIMIEYGPVVVPPDTPLLARIPLVRVLAPRLEPRWSARDEAPLPHVFFDQKDITLSPLCLFDPDREQWSASDLIVDTTVPWTVDWLACYEGWLATGRWHGGGRHAPARGEEAA
jgi:hypothetical protein